MSEFGAIMPKCDWCRQEGENIQQLRFCACSLHVDDGEAIYCSPSCKAAAHE